MKFLVVILLIGSFAKNAFAMDSYETLQACKLAAETAARKASTENGDGEYYSFDMSSQKPAMKTANGFIYVVGIFNWVRVYNKPSERGDVTPSDVAVKYQVETRISGNTCIALPNIQRL